MTRRRMRFGLSPMILAPTAVEATNIHKDLRDVITDAATIHT